MINEYKFIYILKESKIGAPLQKREITFDDMTDLPVDIKTKLKFKVDPRFTSIMTYMENL